MIDQLNLLCIPVKTIHLIQIPYMLNKFTINALTIVLILLSKKVTNIAKLIW